MKRTRGRRYFFSAGQRRFIATVGAVALFAAAMPANSRDRAEIARGRYLVQAGDCEACHTDRGGRAFAGGRAITTPFGKIYSRNITPDAATGIGDWNEADFYRAMHDGLSRDGKHLYPAFPYPWFTKLSRADVHSIKVYMDTLPPVHQPATPNELVLPLRWRNLVGPWNRLFFDAGEFRAEVDKSATWNRGAYLVEGVGHCSACHSPKNIAGATKKGQAFEGGMGEGWLASDLTGRALDGLSEWSIDEIATFLKTGVNDRTRATGPMAEVVATSTSHLTNGDARAIATYLKDLPDGASAAHAEKVATTSDHSDGRRLYLENCAACHRENGAGRPGIFPALMGSAVAQGVNPATAIQLVLSGGAAASTAHNPGRFTMPSFAAKLHDGQIAELMSYVRQAWGNGAAEVSRRTVTEVREQMRKQASSLGN